MWQRRMELYLFAPVTHVFRHLHPAMKAMENPRVPAWGEANKPRVLDALKLIDRELASRPFIAGESFSIADITALVAVDWMKPARLAVPEELVNLRRWRSEVGAPERGGLNGRIGRLSLKSAEFLAQLRVRCDRVGASNVWPR